MLRAFGILNLGIFIAGVLTLLGQLWFKIFDANVFSKLVITLVIVQVACLVVWYFMREAKGTEDIRSGKMD